MATCILCGENRQLTEEHAPPRWTGDAFFARYASLDPTAITRERHGKVFSVPNFSQSAYVPCDECRQWWNDNFEHRVRHLVEPIIFGEQAEVPREHVTAVATWIGYQSMICSIASADTYFGRFPDKDFRFVRQVGRLPDDHVLWIACRGTIETIDHSPCESVPWEYSPHSLGVFSTTMHLVCRHHRQVEGARDAWHEGERKRAVLRVWPPPLSFEWPPPVSLDRAMYLKFRQDIARMGA
jgi:hypothetical protein